MFTLQSIRHFLSDRRASLSVEAVLIFPLLLWGYFGMFVLFEGYRTLSANTRASYTIADYLSREAGFVTPAYIEGLNDVLDVLTQSPHRTVLRVSVVSFDDATQSYTLEWSYSTAGVNKITPATLDQLLVHIPIMSNPGVAVVVETYLAFEPFMNIALDSFYFESVTVTRPRFASQLCWDDGSNGSPPTQCV